MKDDNDGGSMQGSFRQRRRVRFFLLAVVLVVVLVFGGLFLYWFPLAEGGLVSFVCRSSDGQTFVVNAGVDLADGMDRNEAVEVAGKVLPGLFLQAVGGAYQLLSTDSACDVEGIWTVEFTFGAPMVGGSVGYSGNEVTWHSLRTLVMTINPFDRTVECSLVRAGG